MLKINVNKSTKDDNIAVINIMDFSKKSLARES